MKLSSVREDLYFVTEVHPYSDELNSRILEECKSLNFITDYWNADGGFTNIMALQTHPFRCDKDFYNQFASMGLLVDWIYDITINATKKEAYRDVGKLHIDHIWVAKYNKGDWTKSHHHHPAIYSFVYFVKSPKGSSPLVFTRSGKRIKAEDGKLVLFPGDLRHHVPKNRSDGRVVLAGNIFLQLRGTFL
jgi:hypothetical protein